jgi:hypothetical protein
MKKEISFKETFEYFLELRLSDYGFYEDVKKTLEYALEKYGINPIDTLEFMNGFFIRVEDPFYRYTFRDGYKKITNDHEDFLLMLIPKEFDYEFFNSLLDKIWNFTILMLNNDQIVIKAVSGISGVWGEECIAPLMIEKRNKIKGE